ncbi:hypothetical protein M9H77_13211 [Catharanthus roseus]|uniref:Uncharacterized protein n=1 Tax=Catharanthus roseus TaxID=4058 RepID=A0ACC0BJJ5_CATRO|nr:hypothetical protein M9H77_13211 [Catharanthus roseus]
MKSKPRILDVPLVEVPFQEDIDIAETSRIDVDVQDIGTLVHESDELESVDIPGRSSIVDEDENNEDEEEFNWESDEEEEEEEFESKSDSEITCLFPFLLIYMLRGSKKRAHPAAASTSVETSTMGVAASIPTTSTPVEMSTTLVETFTTSASIPPGTSLSPATAFTPPEMSTPPVAVSTPSATLTLFPQLPYSSPVPTFTSSLASSSAEEVLMGPDA